MFKGFDTEDLVDYVLATSFLLTLGTVLFIMGNGNDVPEFMQNIFWMLAAGLGFKKYPTK